MSESASNSPSVSPSISPSGSPSVSPSGSPSNSPSVSPSGSPSVSPSASPSPIPAGLVDYTLNKKTRLGKVHMNFVKIVFGGGNERYATGGIPLTASGLGMSSIVDAVVILESGVSAYTFEWDKSANAIRILSSGTELTVGAAFDEITFEVMAVGW